MGLPPLEAAWETAAASLKRGSSAKSPWSPWHRSTLFWRACQRSS